MVDINKLHSTLQNNDIKVLYEVFSGMFLDFENYSKGIISNYILKNASESALEVLAGNIGLNRGNMSVDTFRKKLQVYYNAFFLVPTLTSFAELIKDSMGYYPENIQPGWIEGIPLKLSLDVVIPAAASDELLQDLKEIFSIGHELDATILKEGFSGGMYTSDESYTGIEGLNQYVDRVLIGFKGRKISAFTGDVFTGLHSLS